MPRFFLNSREGDFLVVDLEGTNFADLDAARVEALICAREMLGDEIKTHRARGAWHYEITDAAGQVLATVSPKDALTLQPADIKPRQG